jgi:hypothetical protein
MPLVVIAFHCNCIKSPGTVTIHTSSSYNFAAYRQTMLRTMALLEMSAFKTVEMPSNPVSIFLAAGLKEDIAGKFRYRHLVMPYQLALEVS